MRMPDIEGDLRREFAHLFRHHDAPPAAHAPVPEPRVTIEPNPQEEPMSVLTDLENDAKALAAKFQDLDKEGLAKLDAIKANPEAASVLDVLSDVAGMALPAGALHNASAVFTDLLNFAKAAAGTGTTTAASTAPLPGSGTTASTDPAPVPATGPGSDTTTDTTVTAAPVQPQPVTQAPAAQPAVRPAPRPAGPVIGGQA